jgi:hypothetical protein
VRRELLGVAGVDSGQLIVIDPCYIKNDWDKPGRDSYVKFWGQGQKEVREYLEHHGYVVTPSGGAWKVPAISPTFIQGDIREYARSINKVIVTSVETGSNYEKTCEVTCGPNHGGEVDLGVAFSSGLGDGAYEVWATIQDIPGWGERVTKVEIELIPDWEIEEYRREEGE